MNAEVTRTVDHNPLDAAAHPSEHAVVQGMVKSTGLTAVTGSFDSFPNLGGGE